MITLQNFQSQLDVSRLNRVMEGACRDAVTNPKALYVFMYRFIFYCRTYTTSVPRLAATIGSSSLFRDPNCFIEEHAERSMDVAAKVFAASIEEFCDPKTGVSHRTLSYALLDKMAEYADMSEAEVQQIAESGVWLSDILELVQDGYRADPDNLPSLVRAIGFHAATETVGLNECSIIHSVIFSEQRNHSFGHFIKNNKIQFQRGVVSPWYWIVIHGTGDTKGLEIEHSDEALQALNRAVKYSSASQEQIIEWAAQGFVTFSAVQTAFFEQVQQELRSFSRVLAVC
jgi:hypothetical protein